MAGQGTTSRRTVIQPRPEDILSPQEAELLLKTGRGELSCPRCVQPLHGEKVVIPEVYEGVVLTCSVCNFREL